MVLDRVEEIGSITKAVAIVEPKVDVGRKTLRGGSRSIASTPV